MSTKTPDSSPDFEQKIVYLTFDEWESIGFCIIKGSKSRKRNQEGVAVFGFDQVFYPSMRQRERHGKYPMNTMRRMAEEER